MGHNIYPTKTNNVGSTPTFQNLTLGQLGVFYVDSSNPFSNSPCGELSIESSSYDAGANLTSISFLSNPDLTGVPVGAFLSLAGNRGDQKLKIVTVNSTSFEVEGDVTELIDNAPKGKAYVYYAYSGAVIQFLQASQINTLEESNVVGLLGVNGDSFLAGDTLYGEFTALSLTSGKAKIYLY
jgi:hypothetical protein